MDSSSSNTVGDDDDHSEPSKDGNDQSQESSTRPAVKLYNPSDDEIFSPCHILIRQNVELFEATPEDVTRFMRRKGGPKQLVLLGQVGVRCCHCKGSAAGSTFYPTDAAGVFPAAQYIANSHWIDSCHQAPPAVRMELMNLRSMSQKNSFSGAKQGWIDSLQALGVLEDDHGLRFADAVPHPDKGHCGMVRCPIGTQCSADTSCSADTA